MDQDIFQIEPKLNILPMKQLFLRMMFIQFAVCAYLLSDAQFRNTYAHNFSSDHTSLIKNKNGFGYIQASTAMQTDHDVHLMKLDQNGNVLVDKIFYSASIDEFALGCLHWK
jgi:hypothetical protein